MTISCKFNLRSFFTFGVYYITKGWQAGLIYMSVSIFSFGLGQAMRAEFRICKSESFQENKLWKVAIESRENGLQGKTPNPKQARC